MQLPPCGVYRTLAQIGGIEAGRLVYFHNHGNPGPGLYLPTGWSHNRASFSPQGQTLEDQSDIRHLEPLLAEGFYRVTDSFYCCDKQCRTYEPEMLVQLGYNGKGEAILFVPELIDGMLAVPEAGTLIDTKSFDKLRALKIPTGNKQPPTQ